MNPTRSDRGLTLAEAIVAIFVLLAGVVVMVRLFHTSIRYQTLVDNQATAVMLAEREMERVRGWSRKTHTCPGATAGFATFLSDAYPGKTAYQDPDFPGFTIQTQAAANIIYSPCSLFELLYTPATRRRVISTSVRKVTVSVSWGWDPYNGQPLSHKLCSLIALPTCDLSAAPAVITVGMTGSTSLIQGATRDVTTSAVDQDGRPLDDLFYEYVIRPQSGDLGGGSGSVDDARDGRTSTVRNCIYDAQEPTPGISGYGLGACNVTAQARYRGILIEGAKANVDMVP